MLVEVNDRVFLGVLVAKVADDGLHVGLVDELDLDEQFANVVIQETRYMDEISDDPAWVAGQRLRVAWAATDAPDRIVISQPRDELRWDEDLGERVEYTDRWGGYGVVAHRVVE